MNYFIKHITNLLIRLSQRLNKDEIFKLPALTILVLASGILIAFTNLFGMICGIGIIILLAISAIFGLMVNLGEIKTDFSIYDIPQEGEIIQFTKKQTFHSFSQPIKQSSPTSSAVSIKLKVFINKGDQYRVRRVLRGLDDFSLEIENVNDKSDDCRISFFENRKTWKTKSDLRNNKIEQILN